MLKLRQWLLDFLGLLYPNCCEACGTSLVSGEKVLCLHCLRQVPKTYYWQFHDNPVAQMFWGRLPVAAACAYFYFGKGNRYRKLVHKLKYRHRPQIGVVLGEMFGAELMAAAFFSADSVLVPVPLHPRRFARRGYNQSERIASGMAHTMGIPVVENAIVRVRYNETQTKKSRSERMQNVQNIFAAGANIERLRGKRVIVVDDVITTGATLESLIAVLLNNVNCIVSVAALGAAR